MFGFGKKKENAATIASSADLRMRVETYFKSRLNSGQRINYLHFIRQLSFLSYLSLEPKTLKDRWGENYTNRANILMKVPFVLEYLKHLSQDDLKPVAWDTGEYIWHTCCNVGDTYKDQQGWTNKIHFARCFNDIMFVPFYMTNYPKQPGGTAQLVKWFEFWLEISDVGYKQMFFNEISQLWLKCASDNDINSMQFTPTSTQEIEYLLNAIAGNENASLLNDLKSLINGKNFTISEVKSLLIL